MTSRLINLMGKLTPQEKRYFRMHSSLQSGEKTYLKLFDALENQSEYDESKIIEEFKGEKFIQNFSVTKNYLITQILKSLRNFGRNENKEFQVINLLTEFEILKNRGLFDHANSLLKKAKKITAKYELHFLHSMILKKEIVFRMERPEIEKIMFSLKEESEKIGYEAKKEIQLYAFKNLVQMHFRTRKKKLIEYEKMKKDWEQLKPKGELKNLSFRGQMYYFEIEMVFAAVAKNHQKNYEFSKKIFLHWEKNHDIKSLEYIKYLKTAGNYLGSCFKLEKYSEAHKIFKFLRENAPKKNLRIEAEFFNIIIFRELLYYLNTLDFSSAMDLLNKIEGDFIRFDKHIHDSRKLTFFYNISILYLLIGKTKKASNWLDKILHFPNSDHRQDLQRIALFLNIVFNLDMNIQSGSFAHIPSMIDSLMRRINTREQEKKDKQIGLSEFEKLILDSCANYINAPIGEKKAILKDFLIGIQEIRKKKPNVLGAEELEIWLKQKLGMKWKPDKF